MESNKNKILKLVFSDPLTRLKNKNYYFQVRKNIAISMLKDLIDQKIWSILFCDANNLKYVNDNFGHIAGDKGLEALGKIIKKSIRTKRTPSDKISVSVKKDDPISIRFGGDEFLIILPNCNKSEAKNVKNRIQKNIKDNMETTKGLMLAIGIADTNDVTAPCNLKSDNEIVCFLETLIKIAEDNMYKDKAKEIKNISRKEKIEILSKNIIRLGSFGLNYNDPKDIELLIDILNDYKNQINKNSK
jgi:diguanylate cyclase (GGDEF)-like protein